MKNKVDTQISVIERGSELLISENELKIKLNNSLKKNRPLKIKFGVDPTAPDIHLGHTVPIRKLKHFQELGHEIFFLIGDFTSKIGDPSGKNKTRPALTDKEILHNTKTYLDQINKILDVDNINVVYNSHWLENLNFGEFVKMAAQVTMAKILEHNTFRERIQDSETLRFHEFIYPFMQGYDSVELKADVEIGGTDQTYNLTFGRDLQRYYGHDPQICITMPILVGTDGVQKMSKSLGNYIGISEEPATIFDKIMRMVDENIVPYFTLLTDVPEDEIQSIKEEIDSGADSKFVIECKKRLAFEIISEYNSEEVAQKLIDSYGKLDKAAMPEVNLIGIEDMSIVDLLFQKLGVESRSEAKRLLKQNGIKINGRKINISYDTNELKSGDIIQIGKLHSFKFKK